MREREDVLIGTVVEESWLTLEQVAAACSVDPAWLERRLDAGLFPQARSVAGIWRFTTPELLRARRMRRLECDFDAVPELAALMADLLEELDALRAQLRRGRG